MTPTLPAPQAATCRRQASRPKRKAPSPRRSNDARAGRFSRPKMRLCGNEENPEREGGTSGNPAKNRTTAATAIDTKDPPPAPRLLRKHAKTTPSTTAATMHPAPKKPVKATASPKTSMPPITNVKQPPTPPPFFAPISHALDAGVSLRTQNNPRRIIRAQAGRDSVIRPGRKGRR